MALRRGGELQAFQLEREAERGRVGNVYLGKVLRVLPGMQAAFVDCGLERATFLYVGDAITAAQRAELMAQLQEEEPSIGDPMEDHGESTLEAPSPAWTARDRLQRNIRIQDVVKPGQTLLVQVTKDAMRTKGARITRQVTLPGRFLVYMPGAEHIGVSRRIDDPEERERLRLLVEGVKRPGEGFIARTACEGRTDEELTEDIDYLRELYASIEEAKDGASPPTCLHSDFDLTLRSVRDLVDDGVARILLDDMEEHARVAAFVERFLPRFADRVELWSGDRPLFSAAGVEKGLGRALSRKVGLPSGAYLVIDHTEALTAIDVNTGRYVGKKSLKDTILEVNLEAAKAVPEQLRLRDIGGLIVVDFIDMTDPDHRRQVDEALLEAVQGDKARCSVLPLSEFGLSQMTRHRVRDDLGRQLTVPCKVCNGEGKLRAPEVIAYDVLRAISVMVGATPQGELVVRCAPQVISWIGANEKGAVRILEERLGSRVRLEGDRELDDRWSVAWTGGA